MPTDDNTFVTNNSILTPPAPGAAVNTSTPLPQAGQQTPPPQPMTNVVTTTSGKGNNRNKGSGAKKIVAVLGVLLLLGGVAAGVLLVQQQQDYEERASDRVTPLVCPLDPQAGRTIITFNEKVLRTDKTDVDSYTGPFAVSMPQGTYKVTLVSYDNHSDKTSQQQIKEFYRLSLKGSNGNEVVSSNPISDLPESQDFLTEVVNTNLTVSSPVSSVVAIHPAYPDTTSPNSVVPVCAAIEQVATTPSAQCNQVKAFDDEWNPLTIANLSARKAGDIVRFTVSGTASTGSFDKARFTINGEVLPEVTEKRDGTNEFFTEYTIPAGTNSFTIKGEVFHSTLGWM